MNAPLRVPTNTRTLLIPLLLSEQCDLVRLSARSTGTQCIPNLSFSARSFRFNPRYATPPTSERAPHIPAKTCLNTPQLTLIRCSGSLLRGHLLHPFAHRRDVSWSALLHPRLIAMCRLFNICGKRRIHELLPHLRNGGLQPFPHAEELAARLEKQILMKQSVIEQRARLFPITDHLHEKRAGLRSHGGSLHGLLEILREVVLEEPMARLAHIQSCPSQYGKNYWENGFEHGITYPQLNHHRAAEITRQQNRAENRRARNGVENRADQRNRAGKRNQAGRILNLRRRGHHRGAFMILVIPSKSMKSTISPLTVRPVQRADFETPDAVIMLCEAAIALSPFGRWEEYL